MGNKEVAHEVFTEIKKHTYCVSYSYIELGALLLRVQREKLYKDLDHKSYASFLSDPDVCIPRSTAYLYTLIYKFYIEQLGLDPSDITGIEISRLRDLIGIYGGLHDGEAVTEWLAKARTLGRIDFINEVRKAKGLPDMPLMEKPSAPGPDEAVLIKYVDLVKGGTCIICGKTPVDAHHFPQTAAQTDDDRKVIPLCREHHAYAHGAGIDTFIGENMKAIFDWFYSQVLEWGAGK